MPSVILSHARVALFEGTVLYSKTSRSWIAIARLRIAYQVVDNVWRDEVRPERARRARAVSTDKADATAPG